MQAFPDSYYTFTYGSKYHSSAYQQLHTRLSYTGYTQKNGAFSKVNKKLISHL